MATLDLVLNTRDIARSLAFYKALGFRVKNEYRNEGTLAFVEMTYRGGVSISLASIATNPDPSFVEWVRGPLGGGVLISITTSGVDKLHEAARSAGAQIEQPPTDTQFGRQLAFSDPDGYSLMAWERSAPRKRAATKKAAKKPAKKAYSRARRS